MAENSGQQVAGGVVFAIAAIAVSWGLVTYFIAVLQANLAESWPSTMATVTQSKAAIGCGGGDSYFPFVQYSYSVGGANYVGNRLAFGNCGCGSESSAADALRDYPVGAIVRVHYDPAAPSNSVLIVGRVLDDTWLGIGIMTLMVLLFSCSAWALFRRGLTLAGT